jgi:hypothetical protein
MVFDATFVFIVAVSFITGGRRMPGENHESAACH